MKIEHPQINIGKVRVGGDPRVVGVVTTIETLGNWTELQSHDCDLVEVRLDLVRTDQNEWMHHAQKIETAGQPIILTIRLAAEDGQWVGLDQDRIPLFKQGLEFISAVDVELRSDILPVIAQEAKSLSKCLIVSYHDFDKTPPLVKLQDIVRRGTEFGQIVKIATMIHSSADVETLQELLNQPRSVPLCVIGMGPKGKTTRLMFPSLGSCLAYGYLDQPSAPSQLAARELQDQIRSNESNLG